ncbi:CCA tRNA nucleotidyltransferase [Alteromonas sp. H39]|uniref:CCA tRNA nucleotidyltransferase n=1 Tax=Alteromonas sp. H39 TaxID=3389876 RepID=UPI0039E14263
MQTYLVGGAVRDELLGRKVTERDWVVVGATPQQMLDAGYTQVGKDFPVFLHPKTKEEYALARTERKAGQGYTGFICDASASVTLEQDLQRRDLTVNAIAQTQDGELIDPYNGKQDLENKVLRHVSDAFSEDPLRVFRVARFATRYHYLGFTIATDTLSLMTAMATSGELSTLTAERVWQETARSLMERSPAIYFSVLTQCQALPVWFPELPSPPHAVYEALAEAAMLALPLEIRFSCLCTALTTEAVNSLSKRLKMPNAVSSLALLAAKLSDSMQASLHAHALVDLFDTADAWRKPERFADLLKVFTLTSNAQGITHWDERRRLISEALEQAKAVDIKAIIESGVKGPAIKEAVRSARCKAVDKVLASAHAPQK